MKVPAGECRIDLDDESLRFDWGRPDAIGSAAFWIDQTHRGGYNSRVADEGSSSDLREHVVFCMLGGFGIQAETAGAAFSALRPLLESSPLPTESQIRDVLHTPVVTVGGQTVRYRFWRQRAVRIAEALIYLEQEDPPTNPVELRDWLTHIDGVGPKTASWIVRNATGSDDVAIVDIWLVRALTAAGVFNPTWDVRKDYSRYEIAFLEYARQGGARASALDLCVWELGRAVLPHVIV